MLALKGGRRDAGYLLDYVAENRRDLELAGTQDREPQPCSTRLRH